jgi:hypothetical protein
MWAVARFREPMVWTLPCRQGRGLAIVENDANNQVDRRKPSRSFTTLLEALNRHRGKGQQKVTVEHVHVHSGRQAIVAVVAGGGNAITGRKAILATTAAVSYHNDPAKKQQP